MEPKDCTTKSITLSDERVVNAKLAALRLSRINGKTFPMSVMSCDERDSDLQSSKNELVELALSVLSQW